MSEGSVSNEEALAPPVVSAEPRNYWGWGSLAGLFALMIVSQFVSSVSRPKSSEAIVDHPYEFALEIEASGRRALDIARPTMDAQSLSEQETKLKETLDSPISELVDHSHGDVEAAREYGAMRTEQGLDVPPASLKTLQQSLNAADRCLAHIYGAKTLSLTEAKRLAGALPSTPFVYQLAKVQALEKGGDTGARDREFTGGIFVALTVAFIGISILFIASATTWILFMRAKRSGQLLPLGTPANPVSPADADRLAIRAAQIIATFLLLSIPVRTIHQSLGISSPVMGAAVGLLTVAALPVWARIPVDGRLITLQTVGLTWERLGKQIFWGIGGFLLEFPLALALLVLGANVFRFLPAPSHPVDAELANAKGFADLFPIWLFAAVAAPIWEEFMFRGLLFPALGRIFGRLLPAAITASFLFAMIHPQGVAAWCALATVGCVGCALTYQTRSLLPTIVMHMLHNSVVFFGALLMMAKA